MTRYAWTAALFQRVLAVVAFFAFRGFEVQAEALFGKYGVLPTDLLLPRQLAADSQLPWISPSLFWYDPAGIHWIPRLGMLASILVFIGIAPGPSLLVATVCYASLLVGGQTFWGFQWDALLVETCAAGLFVVPWRTLRPAVVEPAAMGIWVLRGILFRLYVLSGYVKLASNDSVWWDLTALDYHFVTQPLPNPVAYYAHRLPSFVKSLMCGQMFGIELVIPWLMVGPDVLRVAAFVLMGLLMVGLAFTGSYGFFQLLTIALLVAVLDDDILRDAASLLPSRPPPPLPPPPAKPSRDETLPPELDTPTPAPSVPRSKPLTAALSRWMTPLPAHPLGWIATVLAAVWLVVGGVVFWKRVPPGDFLPRVLSVPLEVVVDRGNPLIKPFRRFHLVNSYGLFANMTTERREVILEATRDGTDWRPYELPYKPGDIDRPPPIAGLYMPRLDWQLWFAALGTCERNPWLENVMIRLLQGAPEVLALFDTVPFDGQTPTSVRAVWYDYQFAAGNAGYEQGTWWERKPLGLYCEPMTLRAD